MKTIFSPTDYADLIKRIENLKSDTPRVWGKMDVAQMMKHSSEAMKMALGDIKLKRSFMGRIIGGFIKKSFLSEKPFPKDSPTAPTLVIIDKREFEKEKAELLQLAKRLHEAGEKGATDHPHTFFGPLTPKEWGETQWKHLDHHLRQFGV